MEDVGSHQAQPADASPTTPPPAADAGAGRSVEQAPAERPEREVLRRMQAGESWDNIRDDLDARRRPGKPAAKPPAGGQSGQASSTPDGTPGGDTQPQPAGKAEGGVTAETLGLSPKEFNALKRGKVDPSVLLHVPLTNRKAIAGNLLRSQAEADRAFQAQRRGEGKDAPAEPTDELDGEDPEATDVGTGAEGDETGEPEPQSTVQPERATPRFGTPFTLPDADYRNLVDLGGEEFADGVRNVVEAATKHAQDQVSQLAPLLEYALTRFEQQDFDAAVSDLRQQPGFDRLGDSELAAIKEQATILVRASGKPITEFNLRQAVPLAAASLFQTNSNQAIQAQLAQNARRSIQSLPDRGSTAPVPTGGRPMTERERTAAIARAMQEGLSVEDARARVDGP